MIVVTWGLMQLNGNMKISQLRFDFNTQKYIPLHEAQKGPCDASLFSWAGSQTTYII